jgi:hypothetical protein
MMRVKERERLLNAEDEEEQQRQLDVYIGSWRVLKLCD